MQDEGAKRKMKFICFLLFYCILIQFLLQRNDHHLCSRSTEFGFEFECFSSFKFESTPRGFSMKDLQALKMCADNGSLAIVNSVAESLIRMVIVYYFQAWVFSKHITYTVYNIIFPLCYVHLLCTSKQPNSRLYAS